METGILTMKFFFRDSHRHRTCGYLFAFAAVREALFHGVLCGMGDLFRCEIPCLAAQVESWSRHDLASINVVWIRGVAWTNVGCKKPG